MLKFKEPVILLRTCWLIFVNNTCRRVCIDWLYWYSNKSVTGYRFPYSSPLLSIPNLKHAIRIVRYSFWKSHFYFYLFQNLLKKCNKFSICLNHIIFYDSFLCRKIWAFDWQHIWLYVENKKRTLKIQIKAKTSQIQRWNVQQVNITHKIMWQISIPCCCCGNLVTLCRNCAFQQSFIATYLA